MKKTPKKIEYSSPKFQRLANDLARSYVQINQCRKCLHPVVDGYCCTFCGTGRPQTTEAQDEADDRKYADMA